MYSTHSVYKMHNISAQNTFTYSSIEHFPQKMYDILRYIIYSHRYPVEVTPFLRCFDKDSDGFPEVFRQG